MEKTSSDTETNYDANQKSCPFCKSGNTQTIKMMCLNGTSSGSSISQSELAKKYIPPGTHPSVEIMKVGCSTSFIMIGGSVFYLLMLFLAGIPIGPFTVLGVLILIIGLISLIPSLQASKKVNQEFQQWTAKVKLWDQGWICHKCGKTWIP
jgi:hypothetical protein